MGWIFVLVEIFAYKMAVLAFSNTHKTQGCCTLYSRTHTHTNANALDWSGRPTTTTMVKRERNT